MDTKQELLLRPIVTQERIPTPRERYVAYEGESPQDSIRLLPGEELQKILPFTPLPASELSLLEALMKVTQATTVEEIGERPVLASSKEDSDEEALNLYNVEFGRDSLEVALTLIDDFPQIAKTTLLSLASSQGVGFNPRSEEEPGKIIHENRDPETDTIAQKITENSGWEWPYYGSVDTTLLFVQLGHEYILRYGLGILNKDYVDKNGDTRKLKDALKLATHWIVGRMDKSPHWLFEYKKGHPGGIYNQAWRDSKEGFHHADGEIADNTYGIASFSVQVDAYKAFQAAAELFPEEKEEYQERAAHLKEQILDHFWIEDEKGGYFALGSELTESGQRARLKVRTSDMGHILDSDILAGNDPEIRSKREGLIRTLFSQRMVNEFGVRTLANDELRYHKKGYHIGSVWPREEARIARGLLNLGYNGLVYELDTRNVQIPKKTGLHVEFASGDDEETPSRDRIIVVKRIVSEEEETYNLEQRPMPTQAWSVASFIESEKRIQLMDTGQMSRFAETPAKYEFEQSILKNLNQAA